MQKSTAEKIVKALKIGTWVFIAIVLFFLYASFRSKFPDEQHQYTYLAMIFLAIGYFCNFMAKRVGKIFINKDNE